MQEVLEHLATNKLNFDEYPYVQPPTNSGDISSLHNGIHLLQLCTLCELLWLSVQFTGTWQSQDSI